MAALGSLPTGARLLALALVTGWQAEPGQGASAGGGPWSIPGLASLLSLESRTLENGDAPVTLDLALRPGAVARHPVNAAGHRESTGAKARPALEWVRLSPQRRGFLATPSGKPFVPWGFNYDRDYRSRLLEDYWESEWQTVVEDFREMKGLGANAVRVHLQFARFMDGPETPNKGALKRLTQLLHLAEETGLYLDLTGLACYRKSDTPAWYVSLNEQDRWDAQAHFWEAIASRGAGSPAVFCYDLMNEPLVPDKKRDPGDWLTGELAGFVYCQFISLDQAGRPRPEIARRWIAKLTAAIRNRDRRHLLTLGFLPNSLQDKPGESGFVPAEVGAPLDFICVHLYPRSGHKQDDLDLLRGFSIGKPVVIEEIFPLSCPIGELQQFLHASRASAAGWFGFYWGQTPEQLSRSTAVGDRITAEWLNLFQEMNPGRNLPAVGEPPRSPDSEGGGPK